MLRDRRGWENTQDVTLDAVREKAGRHKTQVVMCVCKAARAQLPTSSSCQRSAHPLTVPNQPGPHNPTTQMRVEDGMLVLGMFSQQNGKGKQLVRR